jgi:hypothetical protein
MRQVVDDRVLHDQGPQESLLIGLILALIGWIATRDCHYLSLYNSALYLIFK